MQELIDADNIPVLTGSCCGLRLLQPEFGELSPLRLLLDAALHDAHVDLNYADLPSSPARDVRRANGPRKDGKIKVDTPVFPDLGATVDHGKVATSGSASTPTAPTQVP